MNSSDLNQVSYSIEETSLLQDQHTSENDSSAIQYSPQLLNTNNHNEGKQLTTQMEEGCEVQSNVRAQQLTKQQLNQLLKEKLNKYFFQQEMEQSMNEYFSIMDSVLEDRNLCKYQDSDDFYIIHIRNITSQERQKYFQFKVGLLKSFKFTQIVLAFNLIHNWNIENGNGKRFISKPE